MKAVDYSQLLVVVDIHLRLWGWNINPSILQSCSLRQSGCLPELPVCLPPFAGRL
jgi:hypothetical protein